MYICTYIIIHIHTYGCIECLPAGGPRRGEQDQMTRRAIKLASLSQSISISTYLHIYIYISLSLYIYNNNNHNNNDNNHNNTNN